MLHGINTTVFAYGATGSGKTYTMVGTPSDPGLMVLSLQKIFQDKARINTDEDFDVSCSYLEVYNEVIYDLLVKVSGPLELREDPDQGVCVAGLRSVTVETAEEIMELLEEGNKRRKTESTEANATSSRSHAVLEITVKRTPRNHYKVQQMKAKLSLVDLAGSERAAETNNAGQKLRDGANINRSLLALANCINALGKQARNVYVPYRNSKLTRLLKDGLSGNSRTAMIATVAAASDQYHHSINTLKYADRAKEIKTHIVQNVGTVESHVTDYQKIIDHLQGEVQVLKAKLADRPSGIPFPPVLPADARRAPTPPTAESTLSVQENEADMLAWIDNLVQEMNENIEERINLQKALFEIEDINVCNKYELKSLEEFIVNSAGSAREVAEARERKVKLLDAIKENDESKERLKADIQANEEARRDIQIKIDQMVDVNQNTSFLKILGTFRLQAVRLQEIKFQMAVRDQIISEQRDVISNLWKIIEKSGVSKDRVMDIARDEGIIMDGFLRDEEGPPTVGASDLQKQVVIQADSPAALAPQVSLVGGRAKFRYRFWREYDSGHEEEGSEESSSDSGGAPNGRVQVQRRYRRKESDRGDRGGEVRISFDENQRLRSGRKAEKQLPSAKRRGGIKVDGVGASHNHRSPYLPGARVPTRSQSDVGQNVGVAEGVAAVIASQQQRASNAGSERKKTSVSARAPGERIIKSGRRSTLTGRANRIASESDEEARDQSRGKKRASEGGESLIMPVVMPGHYRRATMYDERGPPLQAERERPERDATRNGNMTSLATDVSIAWPDKANQTAPPVERRASIREREAANGVREAPAAVPAARESVVSGRESVAAVQQLPLNERLAKLKGRLAGLGISRRPTAADPEALGIPRPPSKPVLPENPDLPLDNSMLPPSNMPSRRSSAVGEPMLITDPSSSNLNLPPSNHPPSTAQSISHPMPTLSNGMGGNSGAPMTSGHATPGNLSGDMHPPSTAEVANAMGILGLGPRPDSGRSVRSNVSLMPVSNTHSMISEAPGNLVAERRSSLVGERSVALQQIQQAHRRQLLDKLMAKKEAT